MRSEPLSLDPHLRNEIVTSAVLGNILEPLVGYDADGRLVPLLAEQWDNPDDLTWRLVLRQGVTFHDGHELTADDAVFSLERARSHPQTNFASMLVEIEGVRRLDDRTLEITTRRPYAPLLSKLAFVLIAREGAPSEVTEPIGTGPWRLTAAHGRQRLELERFDGYWGARPLFGRVTILAEPDERRRVELLLTGHVDVIQTVPAWAVEQIEAHPCCNVLARDGLQLEYLALDPRLPPFSDPVVREAVDRAIDRRALVEEGLGGFGSPLGQLAPVNVFGHDPSLAIPPADPARARALLAEAGYADGPEVVIESREGRPVEQLVAQLNAAGFRASSLVLPWPQMYQRRIERPIAAYFGGIVAISADASDVLDSLAHTRDIDRGYGAHNLSGYSNSEVDRLVEGAGSAKDLRERREMLGEVLRKVRDERVFLALYSRHEIHGIRRGLALDVRLDGLVRAADVAIAPSPR